MSNLSKEAVIAALVAHREVTEDKRGNLRCVCGHPLGGTSRREEYENFTTHQGEVIWKLFADGAEKEWAVSTDISFSGPVSEAVAFDLADRWKLLYGPDYSTVQTRLTTEWEPAHQECPSPKPRREVPQSVREAARLQIELLEELDDYVPDELRELANPTDEHQQRGGNV